MNSVVFPKGAISKNCSLYESRYTQRPKYMQKNNKERCSWQKHSVSIIIYHTYKFMKLERYQFKTL